MPPPSLPPTETIRRRYAEYVQSSEFDPVFRVCHPPPSLLVLLPIAALLRPQGRAVLRPAMRSCRTRRLGTPRMRRRYLRLAKRGVPLPTAIVLSPPEYRLNPSAIVPALLLGTFDPLPDHSAWLTETLTAIHGADAGASAAARKVRRMLRREEYQFARRRRLPDEITGGREAYLFDTMVVRAFAPSRGADIVCIADPGDRGMIAMLPPKAIA